MSQPCVLKHAAEITINSMKNNRYKVTFKIKGTTEELIEEVSFFGHQDKSQKAKKAIEDKYRGKGQRVVIIRVESIQA